MNICKPFALFLSISLAALALLQAEDISALQSRAERGDAEAEFLLGKMYSLGEGAAKDPVQGIAWYRKSAEQGNFKAQHNLGLIYMEGRGVPVDGPEAVKWLRLSAEQGTERSQLQLADILFTGKLVPKDVREAVVWYEKVATQGDARAADRLGEIYYSGAEGVEKDYSKAAVWLAKGVEKGQLSSMNILGIVKLYGLGTSKDPAEGLRLFRAAADKGFSDAQANLGRYYYLEARPPDMVQAYYWLTLSARAGEIRSINYLAQLRQDIKPEQMAEAERLLKERAGPVAAQ